MNNKTNPALLRTSYLSNEFAKNTPKSHETIPLMLFFLWQTGVDFLNTFTTDAAPHM
jgi:hypothetical protein